MCILQNWQLIGLHQNFRCEKCLGHDSVLMAWRKVQMFWQMADGQTVPNTLCKHLKSSVFCLQELYCHSTFCQMLNAVKISTGKTFKQSAQTVIGKFCRACRMKLLTTRPSFMCIRGPNVLNILATRTVTFSYNCRQHAILMQHSHLYF